MPCPLREFAPSSTNQISYGSSLGLSPDPKSGVDKSGIKWGKGPPARLTTESVQKCKSRFKRSVRRCRFVLWSGRHCGRLQHSRVWRTVFIITSGFAPRCRRPISDSSSCGLLNNAPRDETDMDHATYNSSQVVHPNLSPAPPLGEWG